MRRRVHLKALPRTLRKEEQVEPSYDAFRTLWRVALDVAWYDAEAGTRILVPVGTIF